MQDAIDLLFQGRESPAARDLKLNLQRLAEDSALEPAEAALTLIAAGAALGSTALSELGERTAESLRLSAQDRADARDTAAIMGMLNRYYRFRHFVENGRGKDYLTETYRAAGLRMNALAKPALGKLRFEMLALAVSVINGCEVCVVAHEKELRDAGASADKIHDLARLGAVLAGIAALVASPASHAQAAQRPSGHRT